MLRGSSHRACRGGRRREPCGKYSPRCPCCWRFAARAARGAPSGPATTPVSSHSRAGAEIPRSEEEVLRRAETSSAHRNPALYTAGMVPTLSVAMSSKPCSWRRLNSSVRWLRKSSGSTSNSSSSLAKAASMLGEDVSSSHMRVPVVSNPKYFSVARFSKTDSPSRCRTRTCSGTTTRLVNGIIRCFSCPCVPGGTAGRFGLYLSAPRVSYRGMALQAMHAASKTACGGLSNCSRQVIKSSVSVPAIEIDSLEKWFPPTYSGWRALLQPFTAPTSPALRGISLEVAEGEAVALLGANGAGKTTLLRVLATLLLPTRGSAQIAGHDAVSDPAAVRRQLGYHAGRDLGFYSRLTGRQNLRFFGRLNHLSDATIEERTRA